MVNDQTHQSHPNIIKRLKRANGHLESVIAMMEDGKPCLELAQQLHAVEKAIQQAKRVLVQDHIEHCLDDGEPLPRMAYGQFKAHRLAAG